MVLSYRVYVLVGPSIGDPIENARVFNSAVELFRNKPSFQCSEYFQSGLDSTHFISGCIYFKYAVPFSFVNKNVSSFWHIVPLY